MGKRTRKLAAETPGVAFLLLAAALFLPRPAWGVLDLTWYSIDGGGATACAGGTFTLGGTIGQPDAGLLTAGSYTLGGGFWRGGGSTSGVTEDTQETPLALFVSPSFPNPFRFSTCLRLDLPEARFARVTIYDPAGRLVRRLCDGLLPGGRHDLIWDGRNDGGHRQAGGVYLLTVNMGGYSVRRSLVMIR
jgi:hypothetical protein